jgi:hypothetical protein
MRYAGRKSKYPSCPSELIYGLPPLPTLTFINCCPLMPEFLYDNSVESTLLFPLAPPCSYLRLLCPAIQSYSATPNRFMIPMMLNHNCRPPPLRRRFIPTLDFVCICGCLARLLRASTTRSLSTPLSTILARLGST